MGLPQLEISRGSYIEIYTPPSPLVQAAAQFRKSVRIWNRDLPNLPALLRMAFGKKVVREFKGFLWSSKPEDSLCNSQKVVGVDHRSLPCEAKT